MEAGILSLICVGTWILLWTYEGAKTRDLSMPQACARGVVGWICGTAAFHIAAVLFGAPVVELAGRTFVWASMLSFMSIAPSSVLFGTDIDEWVRVFVEFRPTSRTERALGIPALSSILGSWLGAIPIPLDWDRPWQAWPTTLIYGTIGGFMLGMFVSLVFRTRTRRGYEKTR